MRSPIGDQILGKIIITFHKDLRKISFQIVNLLDLDQWKSPRLRISRSNIAHKIFECSIFLMDFLH